MAKDRLVNNQDGNRKGSKNANVSKTLEQSLSQAKSNAFPRYTKKQDFRREMSHLLNDGSQCKDVLNGLIGRSESGLSSSRIRPIL